MSAFPTVRVRDHAKHGLLLEDRHGAGDEDTGSDFAGDGEEDATAALRCVPIRVRHHLREPVRSSFPRNTHTTSSRLLFHLKGSSYQRAGGTSGGGNA